MAKDKKKLNIEPIEEDATDVELPEALAPEAISPSIQELLAKSQEISRSPAAQDDAAPSIPNLDMVGPREPGPRATTGVNPSNLAPTPISSPITEDADDEDDSPVAPAAPVSPAQALRDKLAKVNGTSPVTSRMNTGDAIKKLLSDNSSELEDAKAQRNKIQLIAMLNDAGNTAGAALAPMSGIKPDEKFTNNLLATAQQPVSDLGAKQKLAQEALLEIKAQKELASHQVDSPESQSYRAFLKATSPQLVKELGNDQFNNVTAADAEKVHRMVELKQRYDALALQHEANNIAKQGKANEKTSNDQAKAYSEAQQKIASFRGNAGLQQASKDVLNANKALALINQPGMKTTQDLRLLAEEMGKVASGGVPGEHGVEALMPSNLKTRYAGLINFIASKPTDTQANEYIQRNKAYLNEIGKVAAGSINKYQLNMAKSFKHRMRPEDYKELTDGINSNMPDFGEKSNFDKDVIEYASSHNISPEQAQAIKMSRTGGK